MVIGLDCETFPTAAGKQAPELVCLSLSTGQLFNWREAEAVIESLLDSQEVLVGHGVSYDFVVLGNQFRLLPKIFDVYEADRIHDTMIRQKLLDIAGGIYRSFLREDGKPEKIGYSLKDLAKRHLNIQLAKDEEDTWRLRYGELLDVPLSEWPEDAREYSIVDAQATMAVWYVQEEHKRFLADQCRQVRASFWLKLMSCWGMITDPAGVAAFEEMTRRKHGEVAATLRAAGLLRPDAVFKTGKRKGEVKLGSRNTKAAALRMQQVWQTDKPPTTATGKIQLSRSVCKDTHDPILEAYAEYSHLNKVLTTDIKLLREGVQFPIHAHFEELLETGRTSSSPNIQNLPREPGMRECFVPRPGYVLIACDYAGMELHTWAQVCLKLLGESKMAEVLNAGVDPHKIVAAAILGWTYEEVEARCKAQDPIADNARQTGKVSNFGLPGGLGPDKFVVYAKQNYGVIITRDRAVELKQYWLRLWPEAQKYLNLVGRMVDPVLNTFPQVEQVYSGRFRGGVSFTEASNGFFQGLAADAAKAAGWLIARACYVDRSSVLFGSRPVNFVHDEFVVSVPEPLCHEGGQEISRLMCLGAAPWLPDVPAKTEVTAMRRWSKKAKPTFVRGRLVPWEGA